MTAQLFEFLLLKIDDKERTTIANAIAHNMSKAIERNVSNGGACNIV